MHVHSRRVRKGGRSHTTARLVSRNPFSRLVSTVPGKTSKERTGGSSLSIEATADYTLDRTALHEKSAPPNICVLIFVRYIHKQTIYVPSYVNIYPSEHVGGKCS